MGNGDGELNSTSLNFYETLLNVLRVGIRSQRSPLFIEIFHGIVPFCNIPFSFHVALSFLTMIGNGRRLEASHHVWHYK